MFDQSEHMVYFQITESDKGQFNNFNVNVRPIRTYGILLDNRVRQRSI